MRKVKKSTDNDCRANGSRPAMTPETQETYLISLAMDQAERQLRDGTASSQLITHYLKLGSSKERLEIEKLKKENELLRVKAEAIESQHKSDEIYQKALNAFRTYSGSGGLDEEDYY